MLDSLWRYDIFISMRHLHCVLHGEVDARGTKVCTPLTAWMLA